MLEYARAFMTELGFENEAVEALCADLEKILACEEANKLFCEILADYEADIYTDFHAVLDRATEAGSLAGVHKFTAHMLIFVLMSRHLRECYRKEGIDDAIFLDSMCDLKWKLWECKMLSGFYGTRVGSWHRDFFRLRLFALGRLQFEIRPFRYTYDKKGYHLEPTTRVLGVHVPRMPMPFSEEKCDESFARAKTFFADRLGDGPMVFVCGSWLMFPGNEQILHEKSNIRKFMSRFEIISQSYYEDCNELWSVFDMEYTGNIEDFPEDTHLRKAYKDHLRSGGKLGSGFGIFFAE